MTRNLIRLHAKKIAQQMNIDNFLVSSGWCTRFMKQTNKQTAPLGATKYEKRNDQCFIVLKLALELSKYRYQGYLFVFKIYCSNFILEFQIICLFYLTDEKLKNQTFSKKVVFLASKIGFDLYTRSTCTRVRLVHEYIRYINLC